MVCRAGIMKLTFDSTGTGCESDRGLTTNRYKLTSWSKPKPQVSIMATHSPPLLLLTTCWRVSGLADENVSFQIPHSVLLSGTCMCMVSECVCVCVCVCVCERLWIIKRVILPSAVRSVTGVCNSIPFRKKSFKLVLASRTPGLMLWSANEWAQVKWTNPIRQVKGPIYRRLQQHSLPPSRFPVIILPIQLPIPRLRISPKEMVFGEQWAGRREVLWLGSMALLTLVK